MDIIKSQYFSTENIEFIIKMINNNLNKNINNTAYISNLLTKDNIFKTQNYIYNGFLFSKIQINNNNIEQLLIDLNKETISTFLHVINNPQLQHSELFQQKLLEQPQLQTQPHSQPQPQSQPPYPQLQSQTQPPPQLQLQLPQLQSPLPQLQLQLPQLQSPLPQLPLPQPLSHKYIDKCDKNSQTEIDKEKVKIFEHLFVSDAIITNHNIKYQLSFNDYSQFKILSIDYNNEYYNVNEYNNKIEINNKLITISVGKYNILELLDVLNKNSELTFEYLQNKNRIICKSKDNSKISLKFIENDKMVIHLRTILGFTNNEYNNNNNYITENNPIISLNEPYIKIININNPFISKNLQYYYFKFNKIFEIIPIYINDIKNHEDKLVIEIYYRINNNFYKLDHKIYNINLNILLEYIY